MSNLGQKRWPENTPDFKYKTFEDLASALKWKSKDTLAKRVMDIWWQIQDSSVDWRDKLRLELTPEEEKWLREALPETASVFNEWMTTEEVAVDAAKQEIWKHIWAENVQRVEQALSVWEKFSKAGEIFWKLWSEWNYLKAFWVFIAILFWTWKVWDFDWSKKDWNKEEKTNVVEGPQVEIDKVDIRYTFWISFLLKLEWLAENLSHSWWQIDSNVNAVFLNKNFHSKSYKEIVSTTWFTWLWQKLWIPWKDENIHKAITILQSREWVLDKILSKSKPNWRDESIYNLLLHLNVYSSFYWNIENTDIEWYMKKGWDFISIDFEKWKWALNWLLEARLNDKNSPFYWVDPTYLWRIYSMWTANDFDKEVLKLWEEWDKYKKFTEWFKKFKEELPFLLWWWFFAWKTWDNWETKKDFQKFFAEHNFSPREVLELYVITWWDTDIQSYDRVQNSMIFTKVFFMLNQKPALQWSTYLYAIKEWWINGSTSIEIPGEIKSAISFMLRTMFEKAINSTWWIAQRVWWMLDDKEKVAWIWIWLAWIIGLWFILRITSAWAWAARWATAATTAIVWWYTLANIYSYLEKNHPKDFSQLRKDNNINSPEDFEKLFIS